MHFRTFRARLLVPAALVAAGTVAGCDNLNRLMEVENPGQIGELALNDPDLVPAMVTSTVGQFQVMYDDLARAGAILTDEAVNGHNFSQWRDFDLRNVESSNTILGSDIYGPVQRARGAADDYARRIREIVGDTEANRHLGLARVLAYGGYGYTMLGEYFCESPVSPTEPAIPSEQILERAIQRFDGAIQIATAARTFNAAVTPATAASRQAVAGADSIINLSRVGAARAHLWIGNQAQAIQYASQVPTAFETWVTYSQETAYPNNVYQGATNGANRSVGVGAAFRNLNDPRVRHTATSGRGHNGLTDLWDPMVGLSFSGWTPEAPTRFQLGTSMRLASGLEARYIIAEAQGLSPENLAFVNSRRAVGTQAALATLTEAEYMAELRDQRRRDFFLAGYRLGDLRRYIRLYQVDQFPSGPHPNAEWGNYGSSTCFVPHNNERIGNPNYRP
jgi:hypothetical protein